MNDTVLLTSLRAFYAAVDPPPPSIAQRALDHFDLHHVDAIVARLVYDSADGLVGVRSTSTSTTRELSYQAGSDLVDLMVEAGPDGVVLFGQLTPARITDVTITQGDRIHSTRTDVLGRFRVVGLSDTPITLKLRGVVITDIDIGPQF